MLNYLLLATFLSVFLLNNAADEFFKLRDNHLPQSLTTAELKYVAGLSNTSHLNTVLDNICIPRVVGSRGHDRVHNYIVSEMKNLGWHVDVDKFQERTPNFGVLTFRNIITTPNPNAERYVVLACHYDSKYFKDFDFEGATDSAVPCAMLINLATVMRKELEPLREDVDLKLFFFDGEEAFERWGPSDSIYGARHLAQVYENKIRSGSGPNHLQRIDMLVLLDLLGAANPHFYSYFRDTNKLYLKLVETERRLKKRGLIKSSSPYFVDRQWYSGVEDDHLPFLERGVPILHLIPNKFPDVWHTINDNREIVDMATTENLNKILRVFVAEYLHLVVEGDESDNEDIQHYEL